MQVIRRVLAALDWSRTPAESDAAIVRANEQRLARMVAYVRLATVPFLAVPLTEWRNLPRPWIVVVALLAAAAWASVFFHRVRRGGGLRGDQLLAFADVAFCVALMAVGSRAGEPEQRNAVLTELVPVSLVSPVVLAFAVGLRRRAVAAVVLLGATWTASVWPDVSQKLGSDLLGFAVWYIAGLAVATLMRRMAAQTAAAEAHARRLDLALHRERFRRSLHDGVLPIFDGIALDERVGRDTRRAARRGAIRARALLSTAVPAAGFEARVYELADTFLELGLLLFPRVYVHTEPPPHVAGALLSAAHEALANALKYAGADAEVVLFAEATEDGVEISVLDTGAGFDRAATPRGHGYSESLPAVTAVGAGWDVTTAPGEGTKVVLRWPSP
ncbi:sensor histidine kinase [Dactylosporangium sp. NPDC051541]|uniref:sensor histidine kinase n=1 Tax=Dactylosporangium sp. NPDC051541 TaxID=3363977 RepID=UPI00378A3B75